MARGELDLYPRARYSAFYASEHGGVCARCACERWGIRSLWRAVQGIHQVPVVEARPLSRVLQELPGACCDECGGSFWAELPKGTS